MRIAIIEQTVYSLEDVKNNPELLKKVLENYKHFNVENNDWHEPIYEGFVEYALTQGFEVDKMYFSGFWSQGDGAMFEGRTTKDFDFTELPNRIKAHIKAENISVHCKFKHSGHYYHHKSYSNYFEPEINTNSLVEHNNIVDLLFEQERYVCDKYESLCQTLYRDLEKYYEELTSDEAILESLECNGYEFDKNGKIY